MMTMVNHPIGAPPAADTEQRRTDHVIRLGFAGLLGLFLLLTGGALNELYKMERRVNFVIEDGLEHIALIQEMRSAARQRAVLLLNLTNEQDPFRRDEMSLQYDALGARFALARTKLVSRNLDAQEQALLMRQSEAVVLSQSALRAVIDAALRDDPIAAQSQLVHEGLPKQEAMLSILAELSRHALWKSRAESGLARKAFERTRRLAWEGGILLVVGAAGIGVWMRRRISMLFKERTALMATLQVMLQDLNFQKQALDEHAIVSIADAGGNITYVNDKFCRVSGYTREELLGRNHRVVKSGMHPDTLYQDMWETISVGSIWRGEVCNRAKQGHHYWVDTTIVPFRDANGLPTSYISIRTEITAMKEAERILQKNQLELARQVDERTEELRRQLHFNSELMEALPNPVFYTDVNGDYLGVNQAWEHLFGIPREHIVGHKLDAAYSASPALARKQAELDKALLQDGGEQRYEVQLPLPDADTRDVLYYKVALNTAQGDITGLVGAILDMTEYREAERELGRFKKTLDQTQDCVFMFWPISLRFFYANHGAIELVGYSQEEMQGMTPLDITPEFTEASFRKLIRPLLADLPQARTFETLHRHKDGHTIPVEITLQYVQADDAPRFVAVVRDITERKRAQTELQQRFDELQALNTRLQEVQHQLLQAEKMASIGQLAAGVAHEINNPIGYVFSNLGTLENYLRDLFSVIAAYEAVEASLADAAARATVARARQQADVEFLRKDIGDLMGECREGIIRVKKIVQDLKDFSRIDSTDEWQWVDLHQGLDGTLNIVRNELKYKAEIVKEYGALPAVECLASQLNQVFLNMLVNAGHAIEERGTITLRTGTEGERVWLEFEDTGKGIAPEHLQRIFDPFFTTKPVGTGTGLGLSLSYGIVQKHHGRIEVASTVGKGTRFRIWLPVRRPITRQAEGQPT